MAKKKKKRSPTGEDVKAVLRVYQHLMGLQGWQFNVSFTDTTGDDYMTCSPSPGYMRAQLNVNLDNVDSMEVLHRTLVHELLHVQLSHYTEAAVVFAGDNRKVLDDLEEFVVTQIERWPLWGKK